MVLKIHGYSTAAFVVSIPGRVPSLIYRIVLFYIHHYLGVVSEHKPLTILKLPVEE